MTLHNIILVAVLSLAPTALAQNKADEMKQRILAQAQSMSPDDYAFTRTIRTDGTMSGTTQHTVTVEKFDPAKSGEERWTLVSVDDAPPSSEVVKEFQKDLAKRRVPGYYRLANYFGTSAATTADSKGRTVFRFSNLPKDTVIVFNSDVSQNATVETSVNATNEVPFAEQVHFTVKPMRLKLIMKLESYESTARYRIGPEGKPLLVEQTTEMKGSGMGKEGHVRTAVSYSDYRAVNKRR